LYAALMLGSMSQALGFSAFVAALPQMAADLGARGEFIAQLTLSLAALGLVLGALASGWILEKAGARSTLLSALVVYGVSGAAGLFLRDPMSLLASRFAVGFTSACMTTTCVWGIAAEYSGNRRANGLGNSYALSAITAVSSTVLGGLLAHLGGWSLAFLPYPLFGLVGFVLAFVSLKDVRPERVAADSQPYFKRLFPFYLLAMLVYGIMFMEATQFTFILEEDGIRDPALRSLIIGTITTVAAVTGFGYGALQRRLGLLGTFTVGLGCMAVALAIVGWTTYIPCAVLGAALMGIHDGLVSPYLYHAITERTAAAARSRAIGLLSAFSFLGGFLNPLGIAALRREMGLRQVFLVVALLMAVLAVGVGMQWLRGRRKASKALSDGGKGFKRVVCDQR
jgi:MFS family permease